MAREARELGRRYTCSDELAPLRDELAERVFRHLRELAHAAVEEETPVQEEPAQPEELGEPEILVQSTEQAAINITDLSNTEFDRGEDMVTQKTMMINHFVPDARQARQ